MICLELFLSGFLILHFLEVEDDEMLEILDLLVLIPDGLDVFELLQKFVYLLQIHDIVMFFLLDVVDLLLDLDDELIEFNQEVLLVEFLVFVFNLNQK